MSGVVQYPIGVGFSSPLSALFDEPGVDQFLHRPSHLSISAMGVGPRPEGLQATLPSQLRQGKSENGLVSGLGLMEEIDIQLESGWTQIALFWKVDVGHRDLRK